MQLLPLVIAVVGTWMFVRAIQTLDSPVDLDADSLPPPPPPPLLPGELYDPSGLDPVVGRPARRRRDPFRRDEEFRVVESQAHEWDDCPSCARHPIRGRGLRR